MKRIILLTLPIILLFALPLTAQQLSFEHLSLDEGLSQSIVQAMLKDSKGFLWIGTEDGLNRYDGYGFRVFRSHPFDSTALSDGNIKSLFQDSRGTLWIGTALGGLNHLDMRTLHFKSHRADPGNPLALQSNYIAQIHEDGQGNIWLLAGQAGGMVHRLDLNTGHFTHYGDNIGDAACLTHKTASQLMVDSRGDVWVGTLDGLNRWDVNTQSFIHYGTEQGLLHTEIVSLYQPPTHEGILWIGAVNPHNAGDGALYLLNTQSGQFTAFPYGPDKKLSPAGPIINGFHEDCSGCLWVATSNGLSRFDYGTQHFTHFQPRPGERSALNSILQISEDLSGALWMRSRGPGLLRYNPSDASFQHYLHDATDPRSLSSNEIMNLLEDPTGILWIGTNTGGLNKLDHFTEKFKTYSQDSGSIQDNMVRALFEDSRKRLWVGTLGGGLTRFSPDRILSRHYRARQDGGTLPGAAIGAVFEDHQGVFWLSVMGRGPGRFLPENGRFTPFFTEDELKERGLRFATGFFEDSSRQLWILTEGAGAFRLSPHRKKRTHFEYVAGVESSLSSNFVRTIFQDRQGHIWLGTLGGLNLLNDDDGFTRYLHQERNATSLPAPTVQTIAQTRDNAIWLGTFGGGLARLDTKTGGFTHWDIMNSALPSNVIYGILLDEHDRLWMSTNNGISRFDTAAKEFKNYNTDDGLQSREFNAAAYHRGHDGRLYFGGIAGFNVFHPDSITDNPFVPPVLITDLRVFDESLPIAADSPLKQPVCNTSRIELGHHQHDISLSFVLLHFNQPQSNQYQYRLDPYDKKWRRADAQRSASYTHLSPGEYVFMVRAANNDGIWNAEPATLSIKIHPPWWRTGSAYLAYVILAIVGLLGVNRFMKSLVLRKERQRARLMEIELRAQAAEAQARVLEAEEARMKDELEKARDLQLSLLPKELPELDHLEVAAYMQTATEVGGDYYDFHQDDQGGLTLALGDATGHGLNAGTVVTLVKSLFVAHAYQGDMRSLFADITQTIRHMELGKLYMGLILARFTDHELSLTSAGMPPVYLWRQDAEELIPLVTKSMPLGAMANFPYTEHKVTLSSGDTLLFMSDGLSELFNETREEFDFTRVERVFIENAHQTPRAIIDHLVTAANTWRNGHPLHDDMTMVVVKIL